MGLFCLEDDPSGELATTCRVSWLKKPNRMTIEEIQMASIVHVAACTVSGFSLAV